MLTSEPFNEIETALRRSGVRSTEDKLRAAAAKAKAEAGGDMRAAAALFLEEADDAMLRFALERNEQFRAAVIALIRDYAPAGPARDDAVTKTKASMSKDQGSPVSSGSAENAARRQKHSVNSVDQGLSASRGVSSAKPSTVTPQALASVARFRNSFYSDVLIDGQPWWEANAERVAAAAERHTRIGRFFDYISRSVANRLKPIGLQLSDTVLTLAGRHALETLPT